MRRKTNPMNDLIEWLVPDQLELVLGELHAFVASPVGDLSNDLAALLDRFGDGIKPALHAMLCDEAGRSRSAASRALRHSVEAGVALLVPILVKDFKLDAVAAVSVATLVIKAVATRGQGKLCEELSKSARPRPKKPRRPPRKSPKKRPARKTPSPRKRRPAKRR